MLQNSTVFRLINSMLLLDKSIAFIAQKTCFLSIKRMLSSHEKRRNRPFLSVFFTFTCYLLPITYYLIAAGVSRWSHEDDKNFGRFLTIPVAFLQLLTFRAKRGETHHKLRLCDSSAADHSQKDRGKKGCGSTLRQNEDSFGGFHSYSSKSLAIPK